MLLVDEFTFYCKYQDHFCSFESFHFFLSKVFLFDDAKERKKGNYFGFFITLFNTVLSAALKNPLFLRTLASNPGQLRLQHWLSVALTTRLDLIHSQGKGTRDMLSPDTVLSFPQGLKKVKAQGFGANTDEEMDQYGKNDMRALSEMLGNKVITVMAALCAPSLANLDAE
jgi:hypothetical protein